MVYYCTNINCNYRSRKKSHPRKCPKCGAAVKYSDESRQTQLDIILGGQ